MHAPQDLPPLSTYEVDFHPGFYTADICTQQNNNSLPLYYTPVSEASDFSETLTPLSIHPPGDFRSSPSPHRGAQHLSPPQHHLEFNAPSRPQSSPSVFQAAARPRTPEPRKPSREGLGIDAPIHLSPVSSPKPHHTSSITLGSPLPAPPRRYYTPIAPHPAGLRQLQATKRSISSDDDHLESPSKKRKMSESSSPTNVEISEEDSFLLRLKDEEGLTWKDIAARFQSDLGKTVQIPALQMRLKRLKERMRVWTELDLQALRMAHDHWISSKFSIIASKV